MGRRNVSGIETQCSNCGYIWFYQGDGDVTSCPRCGWRVRIRPTQRTSTPASNELLTERKRERLI